MQRLLDWLRKAMRTVFLIDFLLKIKIFFEKFSEKRALL